MDNDRYYQLGSYDKLFNKIDELEAALGCRDIEIAELRDQMKMILDRFSALIKCAPADVECNNMHHKKQDQHSYEETCPVVVRYATALYDAQEAFAATKHHASS